MKMLEAHYGSLDALNEQLQLVVKAEHPTPHTELSILMLPALSHDGVTEDEFDYGFGRKDFPMLLDVLIDAVNESFPGPSGKAEEGDQGDSSPGATSTTSPPSALVGAAASSGT